MHYNCQMDGPPVNKLSNPWIAILQYGVAFCGIDYRGSQLVEVVITVGEP